MSSSHTPSTDRLHGLDSLRGIALLLGIVLHGSLAYLPTAIWPFADSATSPVATVIFFFIHLFRMTTFFVIAGLFAHMLLQRRGIGGFVKDRFWRIANPLFGMWWVVFPAIIAVFIWKAAIDNGGTIPTDGPPSPPLTLATFPLTHLWFLWVLLILYAGWLVLRAPVVALDKEGAVGRMVDRMAGLLVGPASHWVLAIPLAVAFWFTPQWYAIFGIPTPDAGFVPNATALVAFGVAFGFGLLLNRRRDLLDRIARLWPLYLVVAIGTGTGALMLAGGPVYALEPVVEPGTKAALAVLYAVAVYASTLAVIGLSLAFLSGYSAVRRYLADSSYWIYIVHLPLVMAGHVLMLEVAWPWWVKLAAVSGGVLAIGLVSYELLVRHTFIGKGLNGRRVPWRRAKAPVVVAAE